MTTKAHTPGPWNLVVGFADWGMPMSHTIWPDGAADNYENVIAEIPSVQPYCMGAKQKDLKRCRAQAANARLISAAPEMLELLEWLDRRGGLGLDTHALIRAAIAKATGSDDATGEAQ